MDGVWHDILQTLRERTNEHNFNLWFRPIRVASQTDSSWTLAVPNRFLKDWITDNYIDILERAIYEVTQQHVTVDIALDAPSPGVSAPQPVEPEAPRPKNGRKPKPQRPPLGMPLNTKFIFDRFVVGPSNEFAHAACRAVGAQPGQAYNPLFIYGGTGLGKTHLLQAIGQAVLTKDKNARVAYITSERFMSELISAIATNQMAAFKRRFRDECDVLLMDDIQFIAGKSSTQEEFFHTFNALFELGKQIVVTSDQYPQEIKTLDERIRSRLQSGLVADIKTPDIETRMAILARKAELDNFVIDPEVLRFLAKHIKSNVRELEGSLIRLEAYASLTGASINLNTAREVLNNFLQSLPTNISWEQIQRRVCQYFDIKLSEMRSKSRARKVVVPRQIAMYLLKHYTELSLTEIGQRFGGKDHTTVISSINRIEQLMSEDMNIRNSVEALEKMLEV